MGNNFSNFTVIDVTPTLHGSEYADGDALFNYVEIPKAVRGKGGCSKLVNVTVNSKKAAKESMKIALLSNPQSLEAANTPMDITAAEGAAAGFLGWFAFPDAGILDMGNFLIYNPVPTTSSAATLPLLLNAADGSDSIYFTAIIDGAVTFGSADLTFRFHIQYA